MQHCYPPAKPVTRRAKRLSTEEEPAILASLRQELARLGRSSHAGCPYVIVDIDRGPVSYCLVVDADWLQFAEEISSLRSSLTEDLDLPTAALVAVLTHQQLYHEVPLLNTRWGLRADGVLHLLGGLVHESQRRGRDRPH